MVHRHAPDQGREGGSRLRLRAPQIEAHHATALAAEPDDAVGLREDEIRAAAEAREGRVVQVPGPVRALGPHDGAAAEVEVDAPVRAGGDAGGGVGTQGIGLHRVKRRVAHEAARRRVEPRRVDPFAADAKQRGAGGVEDGRGALGNALGDAELLHRQCRARPIRGGRARRSSPASRRRWPCRPTPSHPGSRTSSGPVR